MIEMINDFSFNYDRDRFEDKNNMVLDIDYCDDGNYCLSMFHWCGEGTEPSVDDILEKKFDAKNYNDAVEKIKQFLLTEEYTNWRIKQLGWPDAPETPNDEKVKELIEKSNNAELKYLRNKTDELEERVVVLEDSVEDLQKWRHS